MDLQLAGRTALVTGGTKGIGRAVVEGLAAEGTTVAFCARTEADVRATEEELRGAGHDVSGTAVDVADPEALTAWVEGAAQRHGGIDVVVANVSALAIGTEPDHWRASFEVDLMHTVRTVDAALPYLVASGVGSVVAVSSVSGREVDFAAGAYGVMKGALVHYTSGLAFQQAGKVRANAVSPGNTYVEGGVWNGIEQGNPDLYATALGLNPTGRMARPEEIAYGVVMLASPRASFITGTHLVIDGALTRGVQL
ncbi:SDR family NAD(P)-dependent oxidoreductase [Pseudonocardia kunmingensis]|uniref:NAD(P)-dependent dehydrogenase (Short-subunit alcohol dehydrogenase family) n=1 Tax=Pseudonocardia kunmingensis TaxID=630975 RepID=A0A543DLH5_9PSEU|nr:SDR family oxidoreductase [Pseudonocardia kunmingensis]TQM10206.1 NAD(P)-dependent dehydrogenase (short-subunit alcohol dehydrogenase family) [Pseudonocardia kunmingensis]